MPERRQSRLGLVLAIARPRHHHMGCEEGVTVMWSSTMHISDVCDCSVMSAVELP